MIFEVVSSASTTALISVCVLADGVVVGRGGQGEGAIGAGARCPVSRHCSRRQIYNFPLPSIRARDP